MKHKNLIREIVLSGLLISMGLIFPMIFHAFNLGREFLPMHIPVLFAGFILSMPYAVAVGALTPLLSSVFTGMPVLFPVMPYMVFELAAYAAVANFLSKKAGRNPYIALIGSMIAGRIVAGVAVWLLVMLFNAKLPGPVAFVISAVTSGLPGIIIQLAVIPPMVVVLKKAKVIGNEVAKIEQ